MVENTHITFTDLILKNLKAPSEGQAHYFDKVQRGLSLLVSSKGAKTFLSKYKLNGKWHRRSIGRVKELSVADARDQCNADRANARKSVDPKSVGGTTAATGVLTVREAITDYIDNHAKNAQRSWDQTEGTLLRACKDWFKRPVVSITRDDLRAVHKRYLDGGQQAAAGHAHTQIKTLWAWLDENEKVQPGWIDPLARVRLKLPKKVRTDVYSDAELLAIWNAAGKLIEGKYRNFGFYTRLMVLLAPRKTSLALLTWGDLDDKLTVWTTPAELVKQSKTANQRTYRTPLPAMARNLLEDLRSSLGSRLDVRVFPALNIHTTKAGRKVFTSQRLERHLAKAGAKGVTLHKLRHTVATWLENQEHSEWERGLVLNHKSSSVTAGYSHGLPMKTKLALLEKWAAHIRSLLSKRR